MTAPSPVRIVEIDVAAPLPRLVADAHSRSAIVVLRRAGTPVGTIDLDLAAGEAAVSARIAGAIAALPVIEALPVVPTHLLPPVSIVVPTMVGRIDDLAALLDSFAALEHTDHEIVLVDNRPAVPAADALPGLVAGRARVRVVRQSAPGVAAARNAGIAATTHEIIAFADDDVRVDPGWLTAIATRFLLDPRLEGLTGVILPAELESPAQIWFERYYGGFAGSRVFEPLVLESESRGIVALRPSRTVVRDLAGRRRTAFAVYGVGAYGAGANMSFRRSALESIDGFDARLGTGTPARGGEDLAAYIRLLVAGARLGYEPAAVVHHRHRGSTAGLRKQLRGNGAGFVATITALVVGEPRHLVWIAAQLPLAVASIGALFTERVRGRGRSTLGAEVTVPKRFALDEYVSYVFGPFCYLRSRIVMRKYAQASVIRSAAATEFTSFEARR